MGEKGSEISGRAEFVGMLIEGPNVGSSEFGSPEVTSNFISLLFDELEID